MAQALVEWIRYAEGVVVSLGDFSDGAETTANFYDAVRFQLPSRGALNPLQTQILKSNRRSRYGQPLSPYDQDDDEEVSRPSDVSDDDWLLDLDSLDSANRWQRTGRTRLNRLRAASAFRTCDRCVVVGRCVRVVGWCCVHGSSGGGTDIRRSYRTSSTQQDCHLLQFLLPLLAVLVAIVGVGAFLWARQDMVQDSVIYFSLAHFLKLIVFFNCGIKHLLLPSENTTQVVECVNFLSLNLVIPSTSD
ncbi:hypothetical protein ACE6H2_015120 [Prunus campanulata]